MYGPANLDGAGTPFDWTEAIGFGRAPYASVVSGAWHCVSGPNGVAIGCFGWADSETGRVNNYQTPGTQLGIVLPMAGKYNLWERAYIRYGLPFPQMIIRTGVRVIVAAIGDFMLKFPRGAQLGMQVYADPFNGLPFAGPVPYLTNGGTPTPWVTATQGPPNARIRVSTSIQPFGNPINLSSSSITGDSSTVTIDS